MGGCSVPVEHDTILHLAWVSGGGKPGGTLQLRRERGEPLGHPYPMHVHLQESVRRSSMKGLAIIACFLATAAGPALAQYQHISLGPPGGVIDLPIREGVCQYGFQDDGQGWGSTLGLGQQLGIVCPSAGCIDSVGFYVEFLVLDGELDIVIYDDDAEVSRTTIATGNVVQGINEFDIDDVNIAGDACIMLCAVDDNMGYWSVTGEDLTNGPFQNCYWSSTCECTYESISYNYTIWAVLCPNGEPEFIRGDVNADDLLDTKDLLYFMGAIEMPDPPCWDAADFDDDGDADLDDAVGLLEFLFDQGDPPPPPYPDCGQDLEPDDLDCQVFPPCEPGGFDPPDDIEMPESGDDAIHLAAISSLEGGRLIVPIDLLTSRNLLAFEFTVDFDPAVLRFVGLRQSESSGEELDFLSARLEDNVGRIRVGGVPDLSGAVPLTAGQLDLGHLDFQIADMENFEGSQLDAIDVMFITEDMSAIWVAGDREVLSQSGVWPHEAEPTAVQLSLPNPLHTGSVISFELPEDTYVSMAVFNVGGQKVRGLAAGFRPSGRHEVTWDNRSDAGGEISPGIYYLRIRLDGREVRRTIAVVR